MEDIMQKQKELIDYLIRKCSTSPIVKALYLKGSIARGSDDEYSDIDFYCLVDEDSVDEMLNLRMEILRDYKKILFLEHVYWVAPQVIVIYEDNIHLDFYTVHEVPHEGADSIKVLYDPENVLNEYKVVHEDATKDELIEKLNSIIYTSQEVYAAFNRKDNLWCDRLLSHMISNLGVIYCVLYQLDKPIVHLKGIWQSIPDAVRKDLDKIMTVSVPGRYAECAYLILEHSMDLIHKEFSDCYESLYLGYLEYMIKVFKELDSLPCYS